MEDNANLVSKRSADWSSVAWILLICMAASIVYGSSLRFFFSQDDFVFLARAARVASFADFVQLFTASDHFYRPVPRVILFVAQLRLFGPNAGAFHLVSLGLHSLNAILLFLLCRSLFGSTLLAGFSGLLYTTHQIPFLAVYWISGIQDLSVTGLLLLSLLLYDRFVGCSNSIWFAGSLAAFGLALLSKEIAATFPALILLLGLVRRGLGRSSPNRKQILLHTLSYGAIFGIYLVVRWHKTVTFIPGEGPYAMSFTLRTVLERLLEYLHDALYLRTWLATSPPQAVSALVLFLGVFALLFWRSRYYRWVIATGLGWFLVSLLPVLFISQPTYSFYAYFPFAGMAMVLATPLSALSDRVRSSASRAPLAPRLAYGAATILLLLFWLRFSAAQVRAIESKDPAGIIHKSIVAREAITQVQTLYPTLPPGSILYVAGLTDRDIWAVGHGDLFRLFYPQVNVVLVPQGEDPQSFTKDSDDAYVYFFGGGR